MNCSVIVSSPVDGTPIRSPQDVHTSLLPHFVGKEVIEIGTRNGDGMSCFCKYAKKATAVELATHYCGKLRERSDALKQAGGNGFEVLCYSSDDAILAQRLRDAGATSVMPAGSPIGSGRGVANPEAIAVLLQVLKSPEHGGRADYPVIVDAGVGTPSDVTIAMELGADGVLLNTGIAHANDPVRMAHAMRMACDAGYLGARAGRIPRKLLGSASSPWSGTFVHIPGE
jgi:hypothetical protein